MLKLDIIEDTHMNESIDYRLSKDDTLLIKGIAICLMLWHHLFYQQPEFGEFVFRMGVFGKVCVALFLFVSGYGLAIQYSIIQYNTITDTFKFQMKRLVKFYANYWVVFLIFVPIGVLIFGRNLSIPYKDANWIKSLGMDFLGIQGLSSYNITWWFNQLIIYFYFLFPILYFLVKKWVIPMLLFGIMSMRLPIIIDGATGWLLHFMLGIAVAQNVNKISVFLNRLNYWLVLLATILLFVGLVYLRTSRLSLGMRIDAFLAVIIALMIILFLRKMTVINYIVKFLGKHSINIYLIHTFIYAYFFEEFIYSFKYPILIFVVLLISTLGISMLFEWLKKAIRLPRLLTLVIQKIDKIEMEERIELRNVDR
jgi:peptidoglycan/LPS O-acetylase OafA/YrhL